MTRAEIQQRARYRRAIWLLERVAIHTERFGNDGIPLKADCLAGVVQKVRAFLAHERFLNATAAPPERKPAT